jgi:hypothetical protein
MRWEGFLAILTTRRIKLSEMLCATNLLSHSLELVEPQINLDACIRMQPISVRLDLHGAAKEHPTLFLIFVRDISLSQQT